MLRFSILTLFPDYFQTPFSSSLLGRACEAGLLAFDFVNLRDFGEGKYRAVDDKQYGGGAGMVMMPTVLEKALAQATGDVEALASSVSAHKAGGEGTGPRVIFLSPQGKRLDAAIARRLAAHPHLVLVCGHYEGVDERAITTLTHEEVSIGDFVLTGGEPAVAVLVDAIARFVPGVVGEAASVEGDTFESGPDQAPGGLKYPVYTRPPVWRGQAVPEVLSSGHHGEVARWRLAQSEARTQERRPDLARPKAPKSTRTPR